MSHPIKSPQRTFMAAWLRKRAFLSRPLRMDTESRTALKDWITIAALMLGGPWALWTFVYEQTIKPALAAPYMRPLVTMTLVPLEGAPPRVDAVPVKVHVTLENPGTRSVRILLGDLTVFGRRLGEKQGPHFNKDGLAKAMNQDKAARARYWNDHGNTLIFSGSAFFRWTFAPGERHEFTGQIWVPQGGFDELEASLYITLSSDLDRLCAVNDIGDDLTTTALVGELRSGKCEVAVSSEDAARLNARTRNVESTDYLALPGAKVREK